VAKKFDVMNWLRKVRDENYTATRGLTPEQLIAQTHAGAKAFEKSQARLSVRSRGRTPAKPR